MLHLPSSVLRKCSLFLIVTLARCNPCHKISHLVLIFALSVVSWLIRLLCHSTIIMWKLWVVGLSLTCCHYDLYVPRSGNIASDVSTLFLLSLLITVFFSFAFVTLTPSKGWRNRLVCTAMCVHIASHAIPSQHLSPPIPPWELWRSLVERHGWNFSEILRDAITQDTGGIQYTHRQFLTPMRQVPSILLGSLLLRQS